MKTIVKHIPFEAVAAGFAIAVAGAVLGATFGLALLMQRYVARQGPMQPPTAKQAPVAAVATVTTAALVEEGHHLFLMNCAHCHADDATGDEGPDLHGVRKSDARFTAIIQNGIKGEMPKFGAKFKDADVKALIAFIRSLN